MGRREVVDYYASQARRAQDAQTGLAAGTRVLFRYSGNVGEAERLGDPIIGRYHLHTGEVVRPVTADEADLDETGPMYVLRFDDGYEGDTFADELEVVR